jgi:iron transport multicopper oxidase
MSYRLQPGPFTGTTFWKAGYGTQAADGLTGGLVVHPTHSNTTVTFDEEIVVHLSDLYHENSKVLTEKYISVSFLFIQEYAVSLRVFLDNLTTVCRLKG